MQRPSPLVPTDSITTAALIHNHSTFLKPSLRALMSNRPGFSGWRGHLLLSNQKHLENRTSATDVSLEGILLPFPSCITSALQTVSLSLKVMACRSALHLYRAVTLSCKWGVLGSVSNLSKLPSKSTSQSKLNIVRD